MTTLVCSMQAKVLSWSYYQKADTIIQFFKENCIYCIPKSSRGINNFLVPPLLPPLTIDCIQL